MKTASNTTEIKKEEDKTEKIEVMTNILFGLLTILTVCGTAYLCLKLQEYLIDFEKTRPDYKIPKFYDFYITLLSVPVLIVKYF
jgi:hypothetical protein